MVQMSPLNRDCGTEVHTIFSEELKFLLPLRDIPDDVASLEQLLATQFPSDNEVDHIADCPICGEIRNTIHRLHVQKFPDLVVLQVMRFSSLDQKDVRPVELPECFRTQNDRKQFKQFRLSKLCCSRWIKHEGRTLLQCVQGHDKFELVVQVQ